MAVETHRKTLWNRALDRYGYVTTADARALGVPPVELRKLAHRGALEQIGRGLYRFQEAPTTERDGFMEAVQWVGPESALSHDSVLALHGLAAANPRVLRVVTPFRVRKTHPRKDIIILRESLPAADLTQYFGIPSTTVARALKDSRDLVRMERLIEAAEQAHREGLLLETEKEEVIANIKDGM